MKRIILAAAVMISGSAFASNVTIVDANQNEGLFDVTASACVVNSELAEAVTISYAFGEGELQEATLEAGQGMLFRQNMGNGGRPMTLTIGYDADTTVDGEEIFVVALNNNFSRRKPTNCNWPSDYRFTVNPARDGHIVLGE